MVAVAEELFSERGYQPVSMDEIAERSGISKPMLYEYFGSKEGLYVASLRRARNRLYDEVTTAVREEPDPDRKLLEGARAYFSFVDRHREAWCVLFLDTPSERLRDEALEIRRQMAELVRDQLLENWQQPEPPTEELEAFAYAVAGACEALALWWYTHDEVSADDMAARLARLLEPGLGAVVG
jgi:AcrR family transcriptional regulator